MHRFKVGDKVRRRADAAHDWFGTQVLTVRWVNPEGTRIWVTGLVRPEHEDQPFFTDRFELVQLIKRKLPLWW
jgi:hypothetical protein